ncbi:MAG: hypothetical protein PHF00_05790 [Elusimicrobia bacterium]|nr:hypothetical protein [Elusimicrobiota bacterium]
MSKIAVLGAIASDARAAARVRVDLDGAGAGRVFEGVGAVSAGASTRLLYDYAEPYRGDVLGSL